ncbi:MAG: ABC transporter ATP-binding protein [Planctomycetota bacterium]|jgi:putative ABC transport system ATP-binding protein
MTNAVTVERLEKTFGEGPTRVAALAGVDLSIPRGEFLAIMGPSGSGKSTLLHLIGGLDAPTRGRVALEDADLAELDDDRLTVLRRRRIGFVFQAFNLVRVLTAQENTALPLVIDGVAERRANDRALAAMERVQVGHRADHRPGELSGGEQQRVAIARALVTEPAVVLADEPTGNLDRRTGDHVLTILRELCDERGQTVVIVTHDPRDAARADRIVRLEDGRIVDEQRLSPNGGPDDVLNRLERDS